MHTVMAQPISGKQVLVVGCGPIGLMAIGICRVGGADRVIAADPNPRRRELAKAMGADIVLERPVEAEVKGQTDREGADVLLEMSGSPEAIPEAFRCVRNGGQVALLGIPPGEVALPWAEQIIFKGLTIHGINGRRMYDTWYHCESFLRRHRNLIEPLITHRLRYDQFEQGIRAMQSGEACKVVLDWQDAPTGRSRRWRPRSRRLRARWPSCGEPDSTSRCASSPGPWGRWCNWPAGARR